MINPRLFPPAHKGACKLLKVILWVRLQSIIVMTTHKNCPLGNKYITGTVLLFPTKSSHRHEAMAPNVRRIKMLTVENVYKVTPMMFKPMSIFGGPGFHGTGSLCH